MKKISISIVVVLIILLACKNNNNSENNKEALKMYEYTPLALLMLDMHDKSETWKLAIENDSLDIEYPNNFNGIFTLEATDNSVRNEEFAGYATSYLQSVNDLVETKKNKKQIKRFNASIDACVACHQVFCQGPIDKINKLYIKESL